MILPPTVRCLLLVTNSLDLLIIICLRILKFQPSQLALKNYHKSFDNWESAATLLLRQRTHGHNSLELLHRRHKTELKEKTSTDIILNRGLQTCSSQKPDQFRKKNQVQRHYKRKSQRPVLQITLAWEVSNLFEFLQKSVIYSSILHELLNPSLVLMLESIIYTSYKHY